MPNRHRTTEELAFNRTVGNNIKYLRKLRNFTQTRVARDLDCTFQQIQKYEKRSNGVSGIKLKNYPSAFATLLNNQTGVIQLTTDAVLNQSKHSAYLAMLSDPVVDNAKSAEKLLNAILEFQNEYLGYLK